MLTKFDEKGYLHETYFRKECLSLMGGIKEFEIMVAKFVSAISSSTHLALATSVSGNHAQRTSSLVCSSIL